MRTIPFLLTVALASAGGLASAAEALVDPAASNADLTLESTLFTSGNLIGDYDPDTNPDGTQTRPGLFGGSGNNPIPVTVDIDSATELDRGPQGAFEVGVELDELRIDIASLVLDLLDGEPVASALSASALYSTFYTVNPSFIYFGGTPISLPLGDAGELSQIDLVQTAAAQGVLTATGDPDRFDFEIVLPVELSITVRATIDGGEPAEFPLDALPLLLPASGSIDRSEPGQVRIELSVPPQAFSGSVPLNGFPFPPVPLELPTLNTETASVILNLQADSLSYEGSIGLQLQATAPFADSPIQLFEDGFEPLLLRGSKH